MNFFIKYFLSFIILTSLTFSHFQYGYAQKKANMMPILVEYATTKTSIPHQSIQAIGTLSPNASITIKSEIAGKIAKIAFAEGEKVNENQLLIAINDDLARANLDDAKAQLQIAQLNLKRLTAAKQTASGQQIDTAKSLLLQAQANLDTAKAQWSKTQIKAPFTGTIGLRDIEVGSYVQPGEILTRLTNNNQLKLDFTIPERFAMLIQLGQTIQFTTDAAPEQSFQAVVYAISPEIDPEGRFLSIRALFDNQDYQLIAGLFARIQIDVAQTGNVIIVPEEAVFAQNAKHWVYVVTSDNHQTNEDKHSTNTQAQEYAQMRQVTIGQRKLGMIEISSGLNDNERIVRAGLTKLRDGSPIRDRSKPATTQEQASQTGKSQ